ncbi:MAG: hypothetical protein JWL59_1271 [Chthoniobacteraceae bacterium]|nr:hypothetical protein [Chthoniobacteraceae bacterium]
MSSNLDPKILSKLRAFAARRRKLIILRGLCAAVAMLLATMMIVALIDWKFVLADEVRLGLSAAAYLAVIIAEWRTCFRQLTHAPGPRRLARLLEHAEPKLREDLLSAVELGTSAPKEMVDSEQFRALVQSDVASRMEGLNVARLLPVNLVRRYVGFAVILLFAMGAGFALTGFQFRTLMLRALLPMANVDRVSQFKVAIVEPKPAEMRVPFGDAIPLVIDVSGGRASKAVVEVFSKSGGHEVLQMSPAENDRFSATIQIGREDVEYRVRAGDAITRKYRLEARSRPHIANFEKIYTYPVYSKVESKKVLEENGDLAALEGSEVELRLAANQQIEKAELRVEQGRKEFTVPLVAAADGRLTARLPLKTSGIYRVHLIAAETGFENKFSPEYEIRAEPDLIPQIELELPKDDLILPVNEIVDVRGRATDDQSLGRVSQMIRINEGTWREVPLVENPGVTSTVNRRWDLFEQGVKPGDLVATKLLAVDLKGNKAESRTLQITITAAGFEAKRLQALEPQRELLRLLGELKSAGQLFEKQGAEAREQFARLNEADPQRKQAALNAATALEQFDTKFLPAWTQLIATQRAADPGHQSADLVLLGRLLARLDSGFREPARASLTAAAATPDSPLARDQVRDFGDATARINQAGVRAVDVYKPLVGSEELEVLVENMEVVAREQERLLVLAQNSGDDAERWAQVASRIRVVSSEIRSLQDLMKLAGEHVSGGTGDRLRSMIKEIEKPRGAIDQLLASAPGKALLEPSTRLTKICTETSRVLFELKKNIAGEVLNKTIELRKEVEPAYVQFEKLRADLDQILANAKLPPVLRAQLTRNRWDERNGVLKAYGDIEEARVDSDTYFVSDLRSSSLALQAMRDTASEDDHAKIKEKVTPLERGFRLLEGGHDLFEVMDGLKQLSAAERWEIYTPRSRTISPRDWDRLENRLRSLPDELGRIAFDDPTRKLIGEAQKILWETFKLPEPERVSKEMKERYNPQRAPKTMQSDVETLVGRLQLALDVFRKPMEEAREALAQMTPKLSEMMAQLAKEAEELKAETEAEAAKTADKPPGEAQADVQTPLAKQEQLNASVGALKDALRADANQQEMSQKAGRERARDADDALAMLKDPPIRAEQALLEAADASEANARKEALNGAADHQQKLADALKQLSEHYANVEAGKPEESRLALRETEQPNGVKEQLDAQYAKAEQMAELAMKSPEELLAQLEKALSTNQIMQQELSAIAKNTLTDAQKQLGQASKQENQIAQDISKLAAAQPPPAAPAPPGTSAADPATPPASPGTPAADPATPPASPASPGTPPASPADPGAPSGTPPAAPAAPPDGAPAAPMPAAAPPNPQLAQAAQKQAPIAQAAGEAGEDVSRAGRHEARLQNMAVGEQLQALGEKIAGTAKTDVPNAQEALSKAQMASQAEAAVNGANTELAAELGQLQAASTAQAASPSGQASQAGPPNSPAPGQQPPPSAASAAAAPQAAQPPADSQAPGSPSAGETPGSPPAAPGSAQPGPASNLASAPATPQEQVWMARTLDALDAAIHSDPNSQSPDSQGKQPGQGQAKGEGKNGQQPSDAAAQQAQNALAAAAQAAAQAMRAERSANPNATTPTEEPTQGDYQAKSKAGVKGEGVGKAYGALPTDLPNAPKLNAWGKLPKKLAEELSHGQGESVAGEYRNQIETYYRVIAEKSKK